LFKIKRSAIPPVIPPTPPTPVFDYVIDIYSDKVVITNPDGSTTQLSSISDLNNWLRNIAGKRIRVNANVEVYDDLILTPNEYWIFGEWIHGNIYLLSGKHTIISFTRLGDYLYGMKTRKIPCYITNYDPQIEDYVDISGSKIYSVYADLGLYGSPDMVLNDITVYILDSFGSYIEYINGDIYIQNCQELNILNSTLRNAYIEADFLRLSNVVSRVGGVWFIKTRLHTAIDETVDPGDAFATLYLRVSGYVDVPANSSATIDLRTINCPTLYRVISIGIRKRSTSGIYNDPLPSGVTYQFDEVNKKLVLTNNTSNSYDIDILYEITTRYIERA